jgi:hypothetical protein
MKMRVKRTRNHTLILLSPFGSRTVAAPAQVVGTDPSIDTRELLSANGGSNGNDCVPHSNDKGVANTTSNVPEPLAHVDLSYRHPDRGDASGILDDDNMGKDAAMANALTELEPVSQGDI